MSPLKPSVASSSWGDSTTILAAFPAFTFSRSPGYCGCPCLHTTRFWAKLPFPTFLWILSSSHSLSRSLNTATSSLLPSLVISLKVSKISSLKLRITVCPWKGTLVRPFLTLSTFCETSWETIAIVPLPNATNPPELPGRIRRSGRIRAPRPDNPARGSP